MLTDDDLQKIAILMDKQKKSIVRAMKKEFEISNRYFDHVTTNHEKRIRIVEKKLNLPSVVD